MPRFLLKSLVTGFLVMIGMLIGCEAWAADAAGVGRDVLSLQGTWRRAVVAATNEVSPTEGWENVSIPGHDWVGPVGGSHYLWYQRTIDIPASWDDRRIFIDAHGARYAPQVLIDGKQMGGQLNGWSPLVVEITSAVKPGSQHRLEIRCQDRGAFVVHIPQKGEKEVGNSLAPVGGYKDLVGIVDRVFLRSTPPDYIDAAELVITPSTRKSTLTVSGRAISGAAAEVTADVLDGDKVVARGAAQKIGADGAWQLSIAMANARCWSPDDPFQYTLRLTLMVSGRAVDQYSQRFGFKEIWTDGSDFYLNGAKRHFLATSTWPNQGWEDPSAIRERVRNIRAGNNTVFRLHTGPWIEPWLEAADEFGLLIVDEAAVYTDGDGFYAYKDDRFWANYRDHIKGMIRRDRNHASLAMYSLGNEILFMNAQRFDPDLPRKEGELARYARGVDSAHPLTFEADLDPDGAYDVIGLHYPHEMPGQRAYPNTADWLGSRKETEAAGGMLGQKSSGFLWDRKKPLYIGEYLWVPQGDYSCGTIWYGEDAILNRAKYHGMAQRAAWYDQTIAYRRSGVSAMCPWTPFNFGGIQDPNDEAYLIQKEYFTPVAAFIANRGLRFYSGDKANLKFDVFNDSPAGARLELQLREQPGDKLVGSQKLELAAAGYALVTLAYDVPEAGTRSEHTLVSVLLADGKPVHTQKHAVDVFPKRELLVPAGMTMVVFDPAGRWPGSVKSLSQLTGADAAKTILIIAADAISTTGKTNVPTIGGGSFNARAFSEFVGRGGKAIVLEQNSLNELGLGLQTRESAATMSFPVAAKHPILQGMKGGDLSYWADDNYVARNVIVRPDAHGARGVTVIGGSDWLADASIVEMPLGRGHMVFMQALVAQKRQAEPFAAVLLQNAVDYLAAMPPHATSAAELISDEAFAGAVGSLGLEIAPRGLKANGLLVLAGGGDAVRAAGSQVRDALAAGRTVYWHGPTPAAFAALRESLGASALHVRDMAAGISLASRDAELLMGISREDVLCTTRPQGWDKSMGYVPAAADVVLEPQNISYGASVNAASARIEGGEMRNGKAVFDRRGSARFSLTTNADGVYGLEVLGSATKEGDEWPLIMVEVEGTEVCWFRYDGSQPAIAQVRLKKGPNDVAIRFINGSEWGGGRSFTLDAVQLSAAPIFGPEVEVLTLPVAVATWRVGSGRVLIDAVNWDKPWPGQSNPKRFASALLANLGASFNEHAAAAHADVIPLTAFKLVGESPYFSQSSDAINCYSNATLDATFNCTSAGPYAVSITAHGAPAAGVYPIIHVRIDGKNIGQVEIASKDAKAFAAVASMIQAGRHELRLVYDNDQLIGNEDRNLFIDKVEFAPAAK